MIKKKRFWRKGRKEGRNKRWGKGNGFFLWGLDNQEIMKFLFLLFFNKTTTTPPKKSSQIRNLLSPPKISPNNPLFLFSLFSFLFSLSLTPFLPTKSVRSFQTGLDSFHPISLFLKTRSRKEISSM